MKKSEKKSRKMIFTDMNDFLMDYADKKLGHRPDLAKTVYEAGKTDLTGLDDLFKDNGVGRKEQYTAVGMGFLRDTTDDDPDQAEHTAEKLAKDAMAYLGTHLADFEYWEEN
ncbi:hypothetical protein [Secundilactobacillus malefermentans]|uniref:Uncharacterized protein n=1 Tax=Secundilactobacillus malefermentans TaxID=176292 RepID=A0A4R5NFQ3_9LACO|nr:hypothetical protein [Secundilactobacillus malefermentans]QEA31172.1 hypothetical protein FGL90_02750 [Secundilactobacillus malefermentans]TDG72934.1 hypothetical protein C5L31_000259 [Secundilactobacillus malefermentans]